MKLRLSWTPQRINNTVLLTKKENGYAITHTPTIAPMRAIKKRKNLVNGEKFDRLVVRQRVSTNNAENSEFSRAHGSSPTLRRAVWSAVRRILPHSQVICPPYVRNSSFIYLRSLIKNGLDNITNPQQTVRSYYSRKKHASSKKPR